MGMIDLVRRRWKYFTAKSTSKFEENADPKVQLEQAIADAQEQHRRLIQQAANVVANQKSTEMQLSRGMEELEKVSASTRRALRMAQEASAGGDTQKAAEYTQTAEAFANRMIATESQVEDLKKLALQSAQAADQAKAAVSQNSMSLQQKLSERQKLLSQLDQAKMQEQLNVAMSSLSETVDQSTPSLDQVRAKIEQRYARAIGTSELSGQTVEARMLEVQQAAIGSEAKSRLESMRAEMGLPSGSANAALPSGSATAGALGQGAAPNAVPVEDAGAEGAATGG